MNTTQPRPAATTEAMVFEAIRQLAGLDSWAYLADLRDQLPHIGREQLDGTLKALFRARRILLSPMHASWDRQDERKVAAGMWLGGEQKEIVALVR